MDTIQVTETSKFLSRVLRHEPATIGLALDTEGWASIDLLITVARRAGRPLDRATIDLVVATSERKRFSISGDGLYIRAVQGFARA